MDKTVFQRVALRYRAIFLPIDVSESMEQYQPTAPVMAFVARLRENGYCVSEELLHALSKVSANQLVDITALINEVMGVNLNWAPLVKGWDVPTGETLADHLITLIANIFGEEAGFKGTRLPCGHLIPEGTFPLERYNGCPFCGTPFKTTNFIYHGQGSKLKELRLFTMPDMEKLFLSLLTSPTPLDATQLDSLKLLLSQMEVPEDVTITMKETCMVVVHELVAQGKCDRITRLLTTPNDILRYLWYEKTGFVQVIEPKYLVEKAWKANRHCWAPADKSEEKADEKRQELMLKYDRRMCRLVAEWLNALKMSAQQAAENMNPKRGMWVQFIHTLRLGEYSRKKGFGHLAEILDVFYHQEYQTWMGKLDAAQKNNNAAETFSLLVSRPGYFARCLFATMLRFGKDETIKAFESVLDQLPVRLVLSLGNAAEAYFDKTRERLARPITGGTYTLEPNPLLALYSDNELQEMVKAVNMLYAKTMRQHYARVKTETKTIYIDPVLYNIPISIGDRTATIQDTSCALQGTKFHVEGDAVRLFLQWGKDLPPQPLDMDLSCHIAMNDGSVTVCAYFNLVAPGAKHSGDIRSIPDKVGTAEYIELLLPELEEAGAKYVTFTCNAYSNGTLSPNLVVGWMNSAYPMTISKETGVAYDPSTVQHIVRISEGNLSKGLVFGVLKVATREIVWMEVPFMGQTVRDTSTAAIEAMLRHLEEKLSIGQLLDLKREAQQLTLVEDKEAADEVYTYEWALNPAEVNQVLFAL